MSTGLPPLVQRVSLDPTGFRRGAGQVTSQFGSMGAASDVAGGKMAKFGKIAAAGFAVAAAAAVGAGVALFKIGETFDKAYDKIRVGTGATGAALKGLENDFKEVVKNVPADFDSASTAIADLNTRLGLTGKPLQKLSGQMLEMSRITGTDVGSNIKEMTRLFGDWGVKGKETSVAMDKMFRISQATGPTVAELGSLMVRYGAPLRQFGFSFDETAALMGKFQKEGVNTELVMGSLRIALSKLSREGVPAAELGTTLRQKMEEIKNSATPAAVAMELFGARAGADMAAAIIEGKFAIDDLVDVVANGSDTIMDAAKDTESLSQKWQKFKNRVLVGLEPLARKVFDGVGAAMDALGPIMEATVGKLSQGIGGIVALFSGRAGDAATGLGRMIGLSDLDQAKLAGTLKDISDMISGTVGFIVGLFSGGEGKGVSAGGFLSEVFNVGKVLLDYYKGVFDGLMDLVRSIDWDAIKETIVGVWEDIEPALTKVVGLVGKTIKFIGDVVRAGLKVVGWMWEKFGNEILGYVRGAFSAIATVVSGVVDVFSGIIDFISGVFTGDFGRAWDGIKSIFTGTWEVIKGVVMAVWNTIETVLLTGAQWLSIIFGPPLEGIKSLFSAVFGFIGDVVSTAWNTVIQPPLQAMEWVFNSVLSPALSTLASAATTAFGIIQDVVTGAWAVISVPLNALKDLVGGALTAVWGGMKGAAETAWNGVKAVIGSVLRVVGGAVSVFLKAVAKVAGVIPGLGGLSETLKNAGESAGGWGQGLAEGGTVPAYAAGGIPSRRANSGPWTTDGIAAIVGEGRRQYPEYVIPTDPQYRKRARGLAGSLLADLGGHPQMLAGGGIIDDIKGIGKNLLEKGKDLWGTVSPYLTPEGLIRGWNEGLDFLQSHRSGIFDDIADWAGDKINAAISALRSVAAGAVGSIWPTLKQGNDMGSFVPGGVNATRQSALNLISGKAGEAATKLEKAAAGRRTPLKGDSTGIKPYFLERMERWNHSLGGNLRIVSGYRNSAQQASLYAKYLAGTGNLAAPPGRSNHERGLAIDHAPASWAMAKTATRFGITHPVGGEPWHAEPARGDNYRRFDLGGVLQPGVNVVRNDTGAQEPLVAIERFSELLDRLASILEEGAAAPVHQTLQAIDAEDLARRSARELAWVRKTGGR